MIKKTLIVLLILITGFIGYFISQESRVIGTTTNFVVIDPAQAKSTSTQKVVSTFEKIETDEVIFKNKTESLTSKLTSYSKIAECLNEEKNYCNQFDQKFRENHLFIKDRTHMHREIANTLQEIKNFSDADPEFIAQIPANDLIPLLKLTDNRSPVLALELLLEKLLNKKQQNEVINMVIQNDRIVLGLKETLSRTKFLYSDMQIISKLNSLMLTEKQFEDLSKVLCQRMNDLNMSTDFQKRVYYASKVKCN